MFTVFFFWIPIYQDKPNMCLKDQTRWGTPLQYTSFFFPIISNGSTQINFEFKETCYKPKLQLKGEKKSRDQIPNRQLCFWQRKLEPVWIPVYRRDYYAFGCSKSQSPHRRTQTLFRIPLLIRPKLRTWLN